MEESHYKVTIEPQGRSVYVLPGTKVLEAAASAGLIVDTPCGGRGTCGKCRVRMPSNAPAPTESESNVYDETELAEGWRLACQTEVNTDTVVYIPDRSLFAGHHQILETAHTERFEDVRPGVLKQYVELSPPGLQDDRADLKRIEDAVGRCRVDAVLLRELSQKLRRADFKGTAVLMHDHMVDFEGGDTTEACYGVAFDIGTTTLVGVLMNLLNGEEVCVEPRMNPQVTFGDDVLSRITHAAAGAQGLNDLKTAILDEIDSMIDALCHNAGIARRRVYDVTFAGNTTMEHLLCGINPEQLGRVPFTPVFSRGLLQHARDLGIEINPRGAAFVFPLIGGFVGGDTVSGMLATKLGDSGSPVLMVDIGTNGEIVLACDGQIWAASTAAGPAFEGARISCGMRATSGAIEKVVIDEDLHCAVLDNAAPAGLCGSGLIDLCAELLRCGIVSKQGRMLPQEELPAALPAALSDRVHRNGQNEVAFRLADRASEGPVSLNEGDVRELQLASAAIRAGINILLKHAGIAVHELGQVLIAGGFGSFIRRSNAQRIGLLPPELDHNRIHYVGNASLSGAKWALLSMEARRVAEGLAQRTEHVELSNDPDFATEFAMAMAFPG